MEIFFVGDLYFNPNKPRKTMKIEKRILDIIQKSDLLCVNLEGVVTKHKGVESFFDKKGPCLQQDESRINKFIKEISEESDVEILFTEANNHIMDYNYESLRYTNQKLGEDKAFVNFIGAGSYEEAYKPFVFERDGIRVGIVSVAEAGFGVIKSELDKYGYAWFLHDSIFKNIDSLRKECDYVIVVSHAGLEEVDIPLPEIRKIYKMFVDMGADMVIGHHPHVIQGKEQYKEGIIYYSLGNFMFDEDDGDGEYNGQSVGIKVILGRECIIEEVPLLYCNGKLDYNRDSIDIFREACLKLQDADYLTSITDLCEKYYLEIYREYYRNIYRWKNLIYSFLKGIKSLDIHVELFDESWLYHNLEVETHRWTVMRGMEHHRRKERKKH